MRAQCKSVPEHTAKTCADLFQSSAYSGRCIIRSALQTGNWAWWWCAPRQSRFERRMRTWLRAPRPTKKIEDGVIRWRAAAVSMSRRAARDSLACRGRELARTTTFPRVNICFHLVRLGSPSGDSTAIRASTQLQSVRPFLYSDRWTSRLAELLLGHAFLVSLEVLE